MRFRGISRFCSVDPFPCPTIRFQHLWTVRHGLYRIYRSHIGDTTCSGFQHQLRSLGSWYRTFISLERDTALRWVYPFDHSGSTSYAATATALHCDDPDMPKPRSRIEVRNMPVWLLDMPIVLNRCALHVARTPQKRHSAHCCAGVTRPNNHKAQCLLSPSELSTLDHIGEELSNDL